MENKELLYNLYKVHSPSNGEKKMRKFIKDYIKRNIPEVELEYDKVGNIYARKGVANDYPCVVSHIDQVQEKHGKDFQCIEVGGRVFGFSQKAMEMRGLGADDKNGIWVCLQVLAKYDTMKCAFFVGEEIGCVGSDAANMDFFADCRYVLQCDRRNGGELITSIWGDLCSQEFLDDCGYKDFGYKQTEGLSTDVGTLKDNGLKVSCVNMSCGYYNPHTDEEWTDLAELDNCLHFVEHIIEVCTKVYPHESVGFGSYRRYGGYRHYGGFDWSGWDDDDYSLNPKSAQGKRVWAWNEKTHSYGYVYEDKEEELTVVDEDAKSYEEDVDEANNIIFVGLWQGTDEDSIVDDVRYFFPRFGSDEVHQMIKQIRKDYNFPAFS